MPNSTKYSKHSLKLCLNFFLSFLHPKPLERNHASKAKSCPTMKGNCSSIANVVYKIPYCRAPRLAYRGSKGILYTIANADQRKRVSLLPQWIEDFDSPHRPHSALLGLRVFHTTK